MSLPENYPDNCQICGKEIHRNAYEMELCWIELAQRWCCEGCEDTGKLFVPLRGVTPAQAVRALYLQSIPKSMGAMTWVARPTMSEAEAQTVINEHKAEGKFQIDYLRGRVMKIQIRDLERGAIMPFAYDRDNGGAGAALRVIDAVR